MYRYKLFLEILKRQKLQIKFVIKLSFCPVIRLLVTTFATPSTSNYNLRLNQGNNENSFSRLSLVSQLLFPHYVI